MPHAGRCRSTPTDGWQQLLLLLTHFTEQLTYKLIRPVVLFGQSPAGRARETTARERPPYRQLTRVAGPHTKHLCCVAAALGYMFHATPLPSPHPRAPNADTAAPLCAARTRGPKVPSSRGQTWGGFGSAQRRNRCGVPRLGVVGGSAAMSRRGTVPPRSALHRPQ